jgi:hypothetical protein
VAGIFARRKTSDAAARRGMETGASVRASAEKRSCDYRLRSAGGGQPYGQVPQALDPFVIEKGMTDVEEDGVQTTQEAIWRGR